MSQPSLIYQLRKAYRTQGPIEFDKLANDFALDTVVQAVQAETRSSNSLDFITWVVEGSDHVLRRDSVLNNLALIYASAPKLSEPLIEFAVKHINKLSPHSIIGMLGHALKKQHHSASLFVAEMHKFKGQLTEWQTKQAVLTLVSQKPYRAEDVDRVLNDNISSFNSDMSSYYVRGMADELAKTHHPFSKVLCNWRNTEFHKKFLETALDYGHPQITSIIEHNWNTFLLFRSPTIVTQLFGREAAWEALDGIYKNQPDMIEPLLDTRRILLHAAHLLPPQWFKTLLSKTSTFDQEDKQKIFARAQINTNLEAWDIVFEHFKKDARMELLAWAYIHPLVKKTAKHIFEDIHSLGEGHPQQVGFLNMFISEVIDKNAHYSLSVCKQHIHKPLNWEMFFAMAIKENKMMLAHHIAEHHPETIAGDQTHNFDEQSMERWDRVVAKCQKKSLMLEVPQSTVGPVRRKM